MHAAGGGELYLTAGTYAITGGAKGSEGGLIIRDNVTIVGDGMGSTTIKVMDGWAGDITGIVRSLAGEETDNFGMRDITLDGNRSSATGNVVGWYSGHTPDSEGFDREVTLERVEIKNASLYGFDPHEQTIDIIIKDSLAHGNGLDGFVADYQIEGYYIGNEAYGNDRHGLNIVTSSNHSYFADHLVYDNGGNGVTVNRGSTDILWPSFNLIDGGESYNNDRAGALIKMSDHISLRNFDIHDNQQHGILLQGAEDIVLTNNTLHKNTQISDNLYNEIQLSPFFDTTTGITYDTLRSWVTDNVITASGAIRAANGIAEDSTGADFNVIFGNSVSGVRGSDVVVFGANTQTSDPDTAPLNDLIFGTTSADEINGFDGNDTLSASSGDDSVDGRRGQ